MVGDCACAVRPLFAKTQDPQEGERQEEFVPVTLVPLRWNPQDAYTKDAFIYHGISKTC